MTTRETAMSDSEILTIPARRGCAVRLGRGQAIRIINTHGSQVIDTWCFNADDPREYMSMEHIRPTLRRIFPTAGDELVTNKRRSILHFETDTCGGPHDTLIASCDDYRYSLLGCAGYHDNCTDNLFAAMRHIGEKAPECPSPLNLWMNIPIDADGNVKFQAPQSGPGDYVVLRARMDCIVVMSACPQDILPINGVDQEPTEAHYQIID